MVRLATISSERLHTTFISGEVVETLGGLDAKLDPDSLSHGQRQMFCLARATLTKSAIAVLDEATSRYVLVWQSLIICLSRIHLRTLGSVDVETDKIMQQIIRGAFADCTVIAIVHRLETILDFDKIAVLDHGQLVEFDTPSSLLGRNSAFKRLYEAGYPEHK